MRILKRILLTTSAAVFALTATVTPVAPLQTQVVAEAATMKLNKKLLTLNEGDTYKLKVTGKGKKKVKWSSSKPYVAKVSKSGNVRAIGKGSTTIRAKVGGRTLTCNVKVTSSKGNPYYAKLRKYIDSYGEYSDLGDKQLKYDFDYNDDPDISDASASLEITNETTDEISFTAFYSFYDEDDELSSVYTSMDIDKNGNLGIIYVSMTASGIDMFNAYKYDYKASDYVKGSSNIKFKVENKTYGSVSDSYIQKSANKLFGDSLDFFDAGLKDEVGFGLKELGFTYYY